ncbi:MAG TPA: glycosyl hydrolase, partial [Lactobacillus sp.]|nr:glycosyl hydrolase [Lactobacillus sp.]
MDEKVQFVLKQLSDTEKAALVSGKNMWFTAALISQKIDAIMMTDGPAGLRKQVPQTGENLSVNDSVQAISYPAAALVASTFNRELARDLGQHLGDEAQSEGISLLLGPGVNIKRSPLGGRNFEYYSEDPLVAGEMGVAYINGLHDRGVGATVKHFAANNRENHRFTNSSEIDERTLREIYLAPFERIVKDAHPEAVMASYNKLNGVQNVANHRLLTEILRDEWGFKGVVMSDWMAVVDHIASLNAGLDLEMPGKGDPSTAEILAGLQDKKISTKQLDLAAGRVLSMVTTLLNQQQPNATYDRAA